MNILIIGGTRNMGHYLTLALLEAGHRVTILNRGITRSDLPEDVTHLKADRTVPAQLETALAGREFDAVVDFVLFSSSEAEVIVDLLQKRTGHYVFLSSGQVYLLRDGISRPFKEADYEGTLMNEPPMNTYDHEEWMYGWQKRRVESILAKAHHERGFPYTSLRLPMVNGERDPFNRLYAYILRMQDNGPILVPDQPNYPLRHVYALDIVGAIVKLLESGKGKGKAYNLTQDETVSLVQFLDMIGDFVGKHSPTITIERGLLEANGFLPDCSPFSDVWMSELDNTLSKQELGITYTPLPVYLERLVKHYADNPPDPPVSYRRRHAERLFAQNYQPQ